MPTENRSTMVSVPRELLERIDRMYTDGMSIFGECEEVRALLAQPAQHQGEPIMLTAVATLVDDGDGGLEASWLLEGGTAELFAGMTLLVAENAPDLCSEDGSAQVYTHPAPAEQQGYPSEDELIANGLGYPISKEDAVKLHYAGYRSEVITILEAWEAIGHDIHINPDKQELMESLRNMAAICAAHGFDMPADPGEVERLRAELEEWKKRCQYNADTAHDVGHERDTLRAQLAKAHGLLRLARQFVVNGVDLGYIQMPDADTPDPAHDLVPKIDAALTASAEPVAPVERDDQQDLRDNLNRMIGQAEYMLELAENSADPEEDEDYGSFDECRKYIEQARAALERKP